MYYASFAPALIHTSTSCQQRACGKKTLRATSTLIYTLVHFRMTAWCVTVLISRANVSTRPSQRCRCVSRYCTDQPLVTATQAQQGPLQYVVVADPCAARVRSGQQSPHKTCPNFMTANIPRSLVIGISHLPFAPQSVHVHAIGNSLAPSKSGGFTN